MRVTSDRVPSQPPTVPQAVGGTPSQPKPFDMAAWRAQFGKVWGAEAKRASARLRKAQI